jgi:hypothetical protein
MPYKHPWRHWHNKTEHEISCIAKLEKGLKILFEGLEKNIISLYFIGSFLRRETVTLDDVDLKLVVDNRISLRETILPLTKEIYHQTEGVVRIGFYSEKQLNNGFFMKEEFQGSKLPPQLFVKYVSTHVLLYGRDLSKESFPTPTDQEELQGLIYHAKKTCRLHLGEKEDRRLRHICKQVFHICELERRLTTHEHLDYSRDALVEHFKNEKAHIVHTLIVAMRPPPNDDEGRQVAYRRILTYWNDLEMNYSKL